MCGKEAKKNKLQIMDFDATQAIPLDDVEDSETDDEIPEAEKKPVAHLKVLKTKGFPETLFPVHEGDNVIGRAESCNILIPLKALSKQHACIEIRGGCHFLYDKGSRNKTKRGKMYLSPEIRYELRNDDEIVFADVKCEYKFVEDKKESPIAKSILDSKNTIEESLNESEEESSDILGPTQPYHDDSRIQPVSSSTPVTSKTRDNYVPDSEDEDYMDGRNDVIKTASTHSIVAETPVVATKTKKSRESISKIAESGSEGDPFKKSDNAEETFVYDGVDDDSEEREKLKRMSLLATQACAATQAYKDNSDEECVNESDCFDAPTQAFEEPTNNNGKIDHLAPTQAYDMSSGDEGCASPVIKKKRKRSPKRKTLEDSTLAYNMEAESTQTAEEIKKKRRELTEGTLAYDMDTESTQTAAEIKAKRKGKSSTDGIQATVQYDLDVESTQTAAEIKAKRKGKSSTDGIQATVQYDLDVESTQTVAEIKAKRHQLPRESPKRVGSDDDTTDDEQIIAPKSKKRVSFPDEEATQVYEDDPLPMKSPQKGKEDTEESETADFACGATLAFDEFQDDDDEEDEVLIPFKKPHSSSSDPNPYESATQGFDEAQTQVFEAETLAVQESPSKSRVEDAETVAMDDQATQVLEETSPILPNEKQQRNIQDEAATQVLGDDQPTQVLEEISPILHGKYQQKRTIKDDEATQVFNDDDDTPTQVFHDDEAPTQVVSDDMQSPRHSKANIEDEVATQVYGADSDTVVMADEEATQVIGSPSSTKGQNDTPVKAMVEDDAETQVFENNETLVFEADDMPKATKTKVESLKSGRILSTGSEATVVGTSSEDEKEEQRPCKNSDKGLNEDETVSMDDDAPTQVYGEDEEEETERNNDGKATFHDAPTQATDTDGFLVPNMPQKVFKKQELPPVPLFSDDIATQPYGAESEEDKTSDSDNFIDHDAPTLAMDEGSPILGKSERKPPNLQDDMATQAYGLDDEESDNEEETSLIQPKPAETTPLPGRYGDEEPTQAYDVESDEEVEREEVKSELAKSMQNKTSAKKKDEVTETHLPKGRSTRRGKKEDTDEDQQTVPEVKKPIRKVKTSKNKDDKDTVVTSTEDSGTDEVDVGARRPKRGKAVSRGAKTEALSTTDDSAAESKNDKQKDKAEESSVSTPSSSRSQRGKGKHNIEQNVKIEDGENKTIEVKNRKKVNIPAIEIKTDEAIGDKTEASNIQDKTPAGKKSSRGKQKCEKGAGDAPGTTKMNEVDQTIVRRTARMSCSPNAKKKPSEENDTVKRSSRRGGESAETKDSTDGTKETEIGCNEVPANMGNTRTKRGKGKATLVVASVAAPTPSPQPKTKKDVTSDDKNGNLLGVPSESNVSKEGGKTGKRRARSKSPVVTEDKEEPLSLNKRGRSKVRTVKEAEDENPLPGKTNKNQKKIDEYLGVEGKKTEEPSQRSTRGRMSVVHTEVEPSTSKENIVKGKKGAKKDNEISEKNEELESKGKDIKGKKSAVSKKENESTEKLKDLGSQEKSVRGKRGVGAKYDNEKTVKSNDLEKSPNKKPKGKTAVKMNQATTCTNDTPSTLSDTESIASSVASEASNSSRARSKRKPSPAAAAVSSPAAKTSTASRARSKKKATSTVSSQDSETSTSSRARSKRKASPVSSVGSSPVAETSTASRARSKRKVSPASAAASSPATKRRAISHDEKSSQSSNMSANSPSVRRRIKTAEGTPCTPKTDNLSRQSSLRVLTPRSGGKKIKVMFTGLIDELGQKIVKNLGGELVDDINQCTHLVTDKVRRTIKFLCAVAKGLPIVNSDWLTSSMKAGSFIDTSHHLIKDLENEAKFSFSLTDSLEKAELQDGILTGFKIHATKSVKPPPNDLKEIIQCAGGQYLTAMPKKLEESMVVISCDGDEKVCKQAIDAGIPVVSTEFILTGILQQETNVKQFQLFSEQEGGKKKRGNDSKAAASATKRKR